MHILKIKLYFHSSLNTESQLLLMVEIIISHATRFSPVCTIKTHLETFYQSWCKFTTSFLLCNSNERL